MDEHAHLTFSSSGPSSPASFFSVAGNNSPVFEFPSSEVPEQWLVDVDGDVQDHQYREYGVAWGEGDSRVAGSADLSGSPQQAAAARRQGRKPAGASAGGGAGTVSHVLAERMRRDKLHRRFCDLRAVVPTVTKMDKASLLADATAYIGELRGRVEQLEAEEATRAAAASRKQASSNPFTVDHAVVPTHASYELEAAEKLEVRMVGQEAAALRLTTAAERHAPARLMDALRALDLPVQHSCVCRLGVLTVQDAVVDVPAAALRDEGCLRAALLDRLEQSG